MKHYTDYKNFKAIKNINLNRKWKYMGEKEVICVILPIYNEVNMLKKAITEIIRTFGNSGYELVLILAEDASTDGSYEQCQDYSRRYKNIIHIHSEKKKGRGDALKRAILFVKQKLGDQCEVVGYLDTDLSTPPDFIIPAVEKILNEKYDIVIGSRRLKDSVSKRGFKRRIFSWGYNNLINILFRTGIRDHQCGFKFFRVKTTWDVLLNAEDNRWFWDTEVLIRAKRKGLKIYEMPVIWTESSRDSKVSVWKDTMDMLKSAVKLRVKLWRDRK